jgi:hypothetical protein
VDRSARVRKRLSLSSIRVRYVSEAQEAVGQLLNASRAGVFVTSRDLPRLGSVVAIQFRSPLGTLVDARGHVRWTTRLSPERFQAAGVEGFGVALREPGREFRDFMAWLSERDGDQTPDEPGPGPT